MDVRDNRTKNLRLLVDKAGSIAAFCRRYSDVDPTYVSQLMNGHRSFGERAARNMEKKIGLPVAALDRTPDGAEEPPLPGWPFTMVSRSSWEKLTPAQRQGIEEWIAAQVAAYLGVPAADTSESGERAA